MICYGRCLLMVYSLIVKIYDLTQTVSYVAEMLVDIGFQSYYLSMPVLETTRFCPQRPLPDNKLPGYTNMTHQYHTCIGTL